MCTGMFVIYLVIDNLFNFVLDGRSLLDGMANTDACAVQSRACIFNMASNIDQLEEKLRRFETEYEEGINVAHFFRQFKHYNRRRTNQERVQEAHS